MKIAPIFDLSPLGSTQSKINVPYWDTVMDIYNQKRYAEVLPAVMNYVNADINQKYFNTEKNTYEIPHGSINVKIEQNNDQMTVDAPFVDISQSAKIPLMRQVVQLNFYPLTITKIVLENDKLNFRYSCPTDLCEPYKLYEIFREICINADKYDDEFITKFKAKRLQEPKVTRFSQLEQEGIYSKVQFYIQEAFDYLVYLESLNNFNYHYDVIVTSLMKIDYYIAPQGYLRTEIENALDDLFGKDPYNDRIHRGKEFLTKLKNYDKTKILDDIYKAEVFIPYKYKSSIQNIRSNFNSSWETSTKEISNSDFFSAFYTLYIAFFRLFYYNNIDDNLAMLITNAMTAASGKPWKEAAELLYEPMKIIMDEQKYNNFITNN